MLIHQECVMKLVKTVTGLAAGVLLLAGCALAPVKPGMSQSEVLASYGTPTRIVSTASGTRLQYSGQPAGQSVVMVDMDAAGKVSAVRQVMTIDEFSKIEPGKWSREDVEREFGRPAMVDHVASWPGDIMTYRWLDRDQNKYYWVYLDAGNRVQRTGQGLEIPIRRHDNN
jgi:hypothetical protein